METRKTAKLIKQTYDEYKTIYDTDYVPIALMIFLHASKEAVVVKTVIKAVCRKPPQP